jgi:hypothetical protein
VQLEGVNDDGMTQIREKLVTLPRHPSHPDERLK